MPVFVHRVLLLEVLVLQVYESNCALEKIIGGRSVSIKEFPYQLSLRFDGRSICGAVLISRDRALTAAHCIPQRGTYSVRAGSEYVDSGGVITYVERAVLHPDFNRNNQDYDLAILELLRPLRFSEVIRPVRLPNQDEAPPPSDQMGYVSGWGTLSPTFYIFPRELRAVRVPILARDSCGHIYNHLNRITPRMFCAGYRQGGYDSCQGDSGGPFVVNGTLYGLVSWGFNCGEPGYPGVYTNVSALRTYIKTNANV